MPWGKEEGNAGTELATAAIVGLFVILLASELEMLKNPISSFHKMNKEGW